MLASRSAASLQWGAALLLAIGAACRAGDASLEQEGGGEPLVAERGATVVAKRHGSLLVLAAELGKDGLLRAPAAGGEPMDAAALPVGVRLDGADLACRRHQDGEPIHYLVFERAGDEVAYGVYGLAGPKNDLPVERPLGGEPAVWEGLDHEAALRRQLGRAGAGTAELDALFDTHRNAWFVEGLRVFFVLDAENAAPLVTDADEAPPRAALIRIELPPG